ncbi:MAG: PorP/SprF family type IX secretion system membrane protein [Bacteroidota bacterium]
MKKDCYLYIAILFVSLLLSGKISGQDSHLSQYYASNLILNPAMTGMFDADYRAHLQYRSQWNSILRTPFETTNLAYDQPYNRFGFGAYLLNYRAGTGGVNFFNILASAAYEITYDPEKVHHLTTGLQLGLIHKSFNLSNLNFDNQYDTTYHDGWFNPALISGENFEKTSFFLPDVNFGVYYHNERKNSTFNPYLGVSGFHLTQPKETYYGGENKFPLRVAVYGGTKIKINEVFDVETNFLFMRQANNNEIQFGALCYYYLEGSDTKFFIGPYYRNKDAVILHIGGTYGEYVFRISYDINVSSLSSVSRSRGGFELSVTYTKEKAKFIPSIY